MNRTGLVLSRFDPLVRRWFQKRFDTPTEPQILGWSAIASGRDALISAPTGSGKTLAAFLICIDKLVRSARAGTLQDETQVVYVSPLKALSNDIHRNLEVPLAEIAALALEEGIDLTPDPDGCQNRRYSGDRSRADAEETSAYPGDHARVAVYPSYGREIQGNAADRVYRNRR